MPCDLLRHLARRADVNAPADAGVFALRVLAHAHHVDVRRATVRERRRETRQQPHRPEVDVLVEALTDRENQSGRNSIGHSRKSERAEINRVEAREPLEAVLVQHPVLLQVVLASPRQLGERQRGVSALRRRFEHRHPRRNHFLPDAVARNYRDLVHDAHIPGGVKRPSIAVHPPSANRIVPVT